MSDYNEAIGLDPRLASAYYNRGNEYYRRGDLDPAIRDFTTTHGINRNFADALINRGIAYYYKGNLDLAISDWKAVSNIDPQYVTASQYAIARKYYETGILKRGY